MLRNVPDSPLRLETVQDSPNSLYSLFSKSERGIQEQMFKHVLRNPESSLKTWEIPFPGP